MGLDPYFPPNQLKVENTILVFPTTTQNTIYLTDFIPLLLKPCKQKRKFYRDLYLKDGLSASQIAERVGISKTTVLERLREQGIRIPKGRKTNPKKYRLHHPPFGFRKIDARLVPDRSEMKVCRMIVHLRIKGMSFRKIAIELTKRNLKNRNGMVNWSHTIIRMLYHRWKEKI